MARSFLPSAESLSRSRSLSVSLSLSLSLSVSVSLSRAHAQVISALSLSHHVCLSPCSAPSSHRQIARSIYYLTVCSHTHARARARVKIMRPSLPFAHIPHNNHDKPLRLPGEIQWILSNEWSRRFPAVALPGGGGAIVASALCRQTDSQTDRQAGRQAGRQTSRQTSRQTEQFSARHAGGRGQGTSQLDVRE